MKKLLAILLFAASSLAFALPSPQKIEQALAANDYASARSMTEEVLREKPEAAKAHLFNAYLLAHVDRNKVAAAEELKNVQRFDKKGDTKGSALFGRVVAELETIKSQPLPRTQIATPVQRTSYVQATPSQSGSHTFVYIIMGIGVLLVIGVVIANREPKIVTVREYHTTSVSPSARSYESDDYVGTRATRTVVQREYNPQPAYIGSAPAPQVIVNQAPSPVYGGGRSGGGMGMMGTAAAVAGGVVAGELLHDALSGGHRGHSRSSYDDEDDGYAARRRREQQDTYSAPAPSYDPTPAVDYESRASSFSSGSRDWDSGSSSSSSSSSSSDWDSGSSSSDSGGGSDW